MPELPEVENVVRSLRPVLVGRRITDVILPSLNYNGAGKRILQRLLPGRPDDFRKGLCGALVVSVSRHGKNILIRTQHPGKKNRSGCLLVHLGMTGRLQFEGTPEPCRRHTHVIFSLDAPACWLHFSDPRRFGKLKLIQDNAAPAPDLGPDPMEVPWEEFYKLLHGHRSMLKALLLNQRFLRGLGNIYADESLFRAGTHPAALGSGLSRARAERLYGAIRETLSEAIELGGSSISSYVNAQGRAGRFQQVHQVYQRTGEPCFACGTPIRRTVIASRSTHFCPRCQTRGKRRGLKPPLAGKKGR
jgi:formamidopyrimidine-DNA glycosylase